jgi:hypothetical protein
LNILRIGFEKQNCSFNAVFLGAVNTQEMNLTSQGLFTPACRKAIRPTNVL